MSAKRATLKDPLSDIAATTRSLPLQGGGLGWALRAARSSNKRSVPHDALPFSPSPRLARLQTPTSPPPCRGRKRLVARATATAVLLGLTAAAALAQKPVPAASAAKLSTGFAFSEAGGEDLYANVCQGCHMSDGKGAVGAATYPSLAGDQALAAAGYPVYVVVHGQHAMPPVGVMMTDDQVAAVVNYVRTHFGNDYRDAVTAADVKAVRQ
jgi:mono/diheme cytochrome c family protein